MASKLVSRLNRLGNPSYWSSWQRDRARRFRRSQRHHRNRLRVSAAGAIVWILRDLAKQSAFPIITAVLLLAVIESVAWSLSLLRLPVAGFLFEPVSTSGSDTLMGASVGAVATFLGLFYATVGVVASTAYQSVPGEIRKLFLEERTNLVYVRGVVRTLVFGLMLVLLNSLGYTPRGLSLVALALMSVTAVVRLMILGGRLFNFFDPSTLGQPLQQQFKSAVALASSHPASNDEATQRTAHADAASILQLYRRLAVLVEERPVHDPDAPSALALQLLSIAQDYGGAKNSIPTAGQWWLRVPTHSNWLTLNHIQLEMALTTSTGVQPALVPDPLWVERAISDVLGDLLGTLRKSDKPVNAIALSDRASRLMRWLASRLQVQEALTLYRVFSIQMVEASTQRDTPDADDSTIALNQMAAAERSILALTQVWLGFVIAADGMSSESLSKTLADSLIDLNTLYKSSLPRPTMEMLERFAEKIAIEITVEGRRVTPSWWADHYAARSLAQDLVTAHNAIIAEIEPRIVAPLRAHIAAGRHNLAATMIFSALELVEKIRVNQPSLGGAFDALQTFRNANTGNNAWPEVPNDDDLIRRTEDALLRDLAGTIVRLRSTTHDPTLPDLYGQAHQYLFQGAFDAILDGRNDLAGTLFRTILEEADSARARLHSDLADHETRQQLAYMNEPVLGAMELSGYALIMQEFLGTGIWDLVRDLWDSMTERPTVSPFLLHVALNDAASFSFSPGEMGRLGRLRRLGDVLSEHGIRVERDSFPFDRNAPVPLPHVSPIVSAFAPGDYSPRSEPQDLFIAEYLLPKLPAGSELPHRTESLMSEIRRFRTRSATDDSASGQLGGQSTTDGDGADESDKGPASE